MTWKGNKLHTSEIAEIVTFTTMINKVVWTNSDKHGSRQNCR